MSEGCIFCKIANGEIPSYTIYEDNYFRAILDISPSVLGHTLLIPKTHAENIFDLPKEEMSHTLIAVQKISSALKDTLKFDGLNILQNNGEAAGQTVFHYHIHIIPRFNSDSDRININWNHINLTTEEFKDIADKLKSKIN